MMTVGIALSLCAASAVTAAGPSQELQDLRRLLELQERQLELLQEQIELTKRRIVALEERETAAMIEIEARVIELSTTESGVFERLVGLPERAPSGAITLPGEEYEQLLAEVTQAEGASVLARPVVAVREGARGEAVNLRRIPFLGPTGEVEFQDVGTVLSFSARTLSQAALALRIEWDLSSEIGVAPVSGPDGAQIEVPLILRRRGNTSLRLETGQGVLLGGLLADSSDDGERTIRHILTFLRPRIVPPGEVGDF